MNKLKNIILFSITLSITSATKTLQEQCINITKFEKENPSYAKRTLSQRFEYDKKLGAGNFGVVIAGEFNDKEIVIKKLNPKNEIEKKLIRKEIEILKNIQNQPLLLNFYFCVIDENNGNLYIFTELLYKDLENDVDFKLRPERKKIEFYIKLAKSIKQLHSLGYVHNDIKPGNFMITDKNYTTPKLIDFGLSTKKHDITIGGSPIYVPLQKLGSHPASEPEMDIVSYGVSIVVLETSVDEAIDIFNETEGNTQSIFWQNFHYLLAKSVKGKYIYKIEDPNFLIKSWRWFKGFFVNNNKDRVYSFEDLLNGLMENSVSYRLSLDEAIELLEKFNKFYIIEDHGFKDKGFKSVIVKEKDILLGGNNKEFVENFEDEESFEDDIDMGNDFEEDLTKEKDLRFLGETKKLEVKQNFEDVINSRINSKEVLDKKTFVII